MRIEGARVGVHQAFEYVLAGHLVDALEHALVALAQNLGRIRPSLAGEHQRQGIVLDALAPQLVHGGLIDRPRDVSAIELERLVHRPVRLALEQLDRMLQALAVAQLEAREDQVRRIDVAGADHVAEPQAVSVELVDVAGEEVAALPVEEFQIAVVDHIRHPLIERRAAGMRLLEDATDPARGRPLGVGGRQRPRRQRRGAGRGLRGAGERPGAAGAGALWLSGQGGAPGAGGASPKSSREAGGARHRATNRRISSSITAGPSATAQNTADPWTSPRKKSATRAKGPACAFWPWRYGPSTRLPAYQMRNGITMSPNSSARPKMTSSRCTRGSAP